VQRALAPAHGVDPHGSLDVALEIGAQPPGELSVEDRDVELAVKWWR